MAGIDAIVQTIERDARAQADGIVAAAKDEAAQTVAAAKAEAAQYLRAEDARLEGDAELARQRTRARCDMVVRQRRLAGKQVLVQAVLDRAREELSELPAEEYFSAMLGLARRNVLPEAGLMLLSEEDLARAPKGFADAVASAAVLAGGSLELRPAPEELGLSVGGGFVLRYGPIDVTCTLDSLFVERADELRDRAAELLFRK